jgi:hypothetical protein
VVLGAVQQEQQLLWPTEETDAQAAVAAHDNSQLCQAAAAAAGRPTTAVVHSVLAAAATPDDGVDTRLAAIREKNSTFDHSADLDIVEADDNESVLDCPDSPCGALTAVAAGASVLREACGENSSDTAAVAAGGLGRQAAAMVLNLDDLTQCTPEVLEIELESMDVEQLLSLKHVLFDAAGGL